MIGRVSSIETLGLVDGPGVRFVVFLAGCKLRCIYCHNPETWTPKETDDLITPDDLVAKIKRYLPYYENGGVTFSGGEPLLQEEFLLETLKLLKKENIHTSIDTAGIGNKNYDEILKYVDLVILDLKSVDEKMYKYITGRELNEIYSFINALNNSHKKVWIRQVIVPNLNDNIESIYKLNEFLKQIKNVEKVELLPFHTLGNEKYKKLNISNPLENVIDLPKSKIEELTKYLKY